MEDKSSGNQKGTKWLNRNVAAMGFTSLFSDASHEMAYARQRFHYYAFLLLQHSQS
jgi:hypothetical protein